MRNATAASHPRLHAHDCYARAPELREHARSSQISRDEVPEAPSLPRGTTAAVHVTTMTITMGQLVSDLYAKYERELHDEELAAVATEIKVAELLEGMPRRRARARKR